MLNCIPNDWLAYLGAAGNVSTHAAVVSLLYFSIRNNTKLYPSTFNFIQLHNGSYQEAPYCSCIVLFPCAVYARLHTRLYNLSVSSIHSNLITKHGITAQSENGHTIIDQVARPVCQLNI